MATVYVIQAEKERLFSQLSIADYLPCNGYDTWLSRQHLRGYTEQDLARAISQCHAVLILLSPELLSSPKALAEVSLLRTIPHTPVVIEVSPLGEEETAMLPEQLQTLPKVPLPSKTEIETGGARQLIELLPPVNSEASQPVENSESLGWNEGIFSAALATATARRDYARTAALVATFIAHLAHQGIYPPQLAFRDLKALRNEREFELMCRYAEAVDFAGIRHDGVQRLYAQALIERRKYDAALHILEMLQRDPATSPPEFIEALGLTGRVYKQRYVNNPEAPEAADQLRRAIEAYESGYVENHKNFWHGVNAVSCLLRAERDGLLSPSNRARSMAQQIVQDLDQLSQAGRMDVWDYASWVEALLALERFDEAGRILEDYIHHPDMKAFEVSSTYRQYEEVLQLDRDPRTAPLLDRLRNAVARYRSSTTQTEPMNADCDDPLKYFLIRLSDEEWQPQNVTDLVVQSRSGKIVTALGSGRSIRILLKDPAVIAIEESRPTGELECDRSLPFIKATGTYAVASETFQEWGDSALIAVIDDGIDVLHETFRDATGQSRIVGIWDQTDMSGAPPQGYSYGTFHSAAAIAGYLKKGSVPAGLGRNNRGHGTHVASIAAGQAAGTFKGGVAPAAKLLIVVSAASGAVGYSKSHVDALSFIKTVAAQQKLPVVVNVSLGTNSGAHDGKSMLEAAFNDFSKSGRLEGHVVVKSAGNERNKRGHAKVTLKSNSLEQLYWRRAIKADHRERIELWWSSADEIEFRLGAPVNTADPPASHLLPSAYSPWVNYTSPQLKGTLPGGGGPYRLELTRNHIDNGDSLLVIELGSNMAAAGHGDWVLEMQSRKVHEGGIVHAWIERGLGHPTAFVNHIDETMTLSIPGTAESVITVSAVDACQPISVGAFSSYGPTRNGEKKPLVCAPGINVSAAEGGTAQGHFPLTGTSMAAPHVSGAIALLLSRATKRGKILSSNQIGAVMRQKTQNYDGSWDPGQGYGVIDVAALLAAFD